MFPGGGISRQVLFSALKEWVLFVSLGTPGNEAAAGAMR